jgi:hypothetical protein
MQVARSWVEWVVGNAPLPDRRSKLMLACSVAAVALIAVGAAAVMTASAPKKSHPAVHNPTISYQLPPSVSAAPTTLPTGATSSPSTMSPTVTNPSTSTRSLAKQNVAALKRAARRAERRAERIKERHGHQRRTARTST